MRTRYLRPGFFENEDLAALAAHGRLLFAGLWLMADRAGRLKDRPPVIRATLFPFEPAVDVDVLLEALARAGFITRYVGGGVKCIEVLHFATHQHPHPREIASKLPKPCKSPGRAGKRHGSARLVLELDPLTCTDPKDQDQISRASRALVRPSDDFATFWHAYPKKTGKAAALKAWQKTKPPIAEVLEALAWQTQSLQWNRDEGRYRPNPATYLNQGRWQDEPEQPAEHVGEKSRTGDTVNAARAYLQDSLRGGKS